mmetsp:Transcript_21806/g.64345  ORF Transcript_21806/g.64345 Transcript_21806/m.64345 type:complete len:201 (+) Transcript_21806:1037-1639(+)
MAQQKLRRMRASTARERSTAVSTSARDARTSTTSAASTATSVPEPMATPTSAWARAGASLMPSPTMATRRPSSCSAATARALCLGSTSAWVRLSSTPRSRATARAVRTLSPVRMLTRKPASRRALTTAAASGFKVSATATTAWATPSTQHRIAVLPSASRPAMQWFTEEATRTPFSAAQSRLPRTTVLPSTLQRTPLPTA